MTSLLCYARYIHNKTDDVKKGHIFVTQNATIMCFGYVAAEYQQNLIKLSTLAIGMFLSSFISLPIPHLASLPAC